MKFSLVKLRNLYSRRIAWGAMLLWAGCAVWVISIYRDPSDRSLQRETAFRIQVNQKLAEEFLAANRTVPISSAELRIYALINDKPYYVFDAEGQRMQYLRLSPTTFVFKTTKSASVMNDHAKIFCKSQFEDINLFSADFLGGLEYQGRNARLQIDPLLSNKQLVVSSKGDVPKIFPYPAVDQFMWLPSKKPMLVVVTSQSSQYRAGVFVWSLDDDSVDRVSDLLFGETQSIHSAGGPRYIFALLGVVLDRDHAATGESTIGLFAQDIKSTDSGLFDEHNFYALNIGSSVVKPILNAELGQTFGPTLQSINRDEPFLESSNVCHVTDSDSRPFLRSWLALDRKGRSLEVLRTWLKYADDFPQSPFVPFALNHIANLYQAVGLFLSAEERLATLDERQRMLDALEHLAIAPDFLRLDASRKKNGERP